MFLTVSAAFVLSVLLIPDGTGGLDSVELRSCDDLRTHLEARRILTDHDDERTISVVASTFEQPTLYRYRCSDGMIAIHGVVSHISARKQAIDFHNALVQALKSEFGSPATVGQGRLEPSCLIETSDLSPFERYNATWFVGETHVIAAVFGPPAEGDEWHVGAMLRPKNAPKCGIQFGTD